MPKTVNCCKYSLPDSNFPVFISWLKELLVLKDGDNVLRPLDFIAEATAKNYFRAEIWIKIMKKIT